jgi:hypothetical protein
MTLVEDFLGSEKKYLRVSGLNEWHYSAGSNTLVNAAFLDLIPQS